MLEEYVYEQPGHLIRRAHQIAWAMFREETDEFDVTPVQYSLLVAVHDFPAVDATRLSELICIDRATIGNIVARLETKGLLVREDDPDDKRAKRIFITTAGTSLIQAINKVRGRIAEQVFAPLDAADRMMLVKIMCKLVGIEDVKQRARDSAADAGRMPVKTSITAKKKSAPRALRKKL